MVNEEFFISENISAFYDAGVRYLFDESGLPDYLAIGIKIIAQESKRFGLHKLSL
jgi:hypothetical protein